jgi:hypothetical protein
MVNKSGGKRGSNKLKRKRGKKFRFYEGEDGGKNGKSVEGANNPFEEHSTSKRAVRDKAKVKMLILMIFREPNLSRSSKQEERTMSLLIRGLARLHQSCQKRIR